jgi:hypothetical protein
MSADDGMDILSRSMAAGGTPYLVATMASAFAIAARAVVTDIESEGVRVGPQSERCYDVRPMLDEREHSPELIDQAREALAFAAAMRIVEIDAAMPHLVRIVARDL